MKKAILFSALLASSLMANYSIGNTVWYDKNQDWVQNENEPGYPDITVALYNESNETIKRRKTDDRGYYLFENIPEGLYYVRVLNLPNNVKPVTDDFRKFWLAANMTDVNFGIFSPIEYTIEGQVWEDKTPDWIMKWYEKKVPNIEIALLDNNGKQLKTTKTNNKGNYIFKNLKEGVYTVKVIMDSSKIITDPSIEFWVGENQKNKNFGIDEHIISDGIRQKLLKMIDNNEDVTQFDTSKITDMSGLLERHRGFNQDIGNWDVSNVTDMSQMFYDATSFNQDISKWDTSNVVNMSEMFFKATSFNQPLNDLNVSNVTNMKRLFWRAESFNQPLDKWDVSKVTNMALTFNGSPFNQNISNWNVDKVRFWFNFSSESMEESNKPKKFRK